MFENPSKYEAAYLGLFPAGDPEIAIALAWATERAESSAEVMVVAPTRDHFRENAILRQLPSGLRQETPQTLRRSWGTPVVVACWPDEKALDLLDSLRSLRALCVVPWLAADIETWRRARAAVDITGESGPEGPPTISDSVVLQAMRSLTTRVNLGTGLHHPNDKAAAVELFRILKRGRHQWDPAEVRTWAMANGWKADHARDLGQLAEGVQSGRRYRGATGIWAPGILETWRSRSRAVGA